MTIEEFEERFFIDVYTNCWIWFRATAKRYGTLRIRGASVQAHRLAWELYRGPIPSGLHVCHICDNPPCVNPAHLFIGTMSDNLKDCYSKGRHSRPTGNPSKLTWKQISKIRAMPYRRGMMTETARALGVSRALVSWHWWNRKGGRTLVEVFGEEQDRKTGELLADIERKSALGEIK
jgi:HNH endonuclease